MRKNQNDTQTTTTLQAIFSELDKTSTEADRALFDGKVQGMVVSLYEDERPLRGLAGLLDWHFRGAISRFVQQAK